MEDQREQSDTHGVQPGTGELHPEIASNGTSSVPSEERQKTEIVDCLAPWPNDDEITDQAFEIMRQRGYLPRHDHND